MMYGKALLFDDQEIAEKVLKSSNPGSQKALGRKVKNFDQKVWTENARKIVYKANEAKFKQNEHLLKKLLKTKDTTLVEASPVDPIWGIGLAEDNPHAHNRHTWRGKNWLGQVLTKLREDILAEKAESLNK